MSTSYKIMKYMTKIEETNDLRKLKIYIHKLEKYKNTQLGGAGPEIPDLTKYVMSGIESNISQQSQKNIDDNKDLMDGMDYIHKTIETVFKSIDQITKDIPALIESSNKDIEKLCDYGKIRTAVTDIVKSITDSVSDINTKMESAAKKEEKKEKKEDDVKKINEEKEVSKKD